MPYDTWTNQRLSLSSATFYGYVTCVVVKPLYFLIGGTINHQNEKRLAKTIYLSDEEQQNSDMLQTKCLMMTEKGEEK